MYNTFYILILMVYNIYIYHKYTHNICIDHILYKCIKKAFVNIMLLRPIPYFFLQIFYWNFYLCIPSGLYVPVFAYA